MVKIWIKKGNKFLLLQPINTFHCSDWFKNDMLVQKRLQQIKTFFYLPKAAARKREALVVRIFCVGLMEEQLPTPPPPLLLSESLPFWFDILRQPSVGDLMWGLVLDAVINDNDGDDVSLGLRQNVWIIGIKVESGDLQLEIYMMFGQLMHAREKQKIMQKSLNNDVRRTGETVKLI